MTLETHYSIPASVMLQVIDDEILLFNSNNGQFFAINEVGAGMWEVMQDYTTLAEVLEELQKYFKVSPKQLSSDLLVFTVSLLEQELITCD